MLVLLGVSREDTEAEADRLAEKVRALRIFDDAEGRMNEPLGDREILCVSQFTLYGDARKGNRPSYVQAAPAEEAEPLYDRFCEQARREEGRLRRLHGGRAGQRRPGHRDARGLIPGRREILAAMSRENIEVLRVPVSLRATSRRTVPERLAMRFPNALALGIRAALRLPLRSRVRVRLSRHAARMFTEAINRGDFEASFGLYHPEAELVVAGGLPTLGLEGATGPAERIRFQERWMADWGEFRFEPEELLVFGDDRRFRGYTQPTFLRTRTWRWARAHLFLRGSGAGGRDENNLETE